MKILFTSVGRRVELIQAFKEAAYQLSFSLEIYGVDLSETAPALKYCDHALSICRINDPQYIPTLIQLCEENQIDALIPTIDTDLLLLSSNKDLFEAVGTRVVVSSPDKIALCRDKRFTGAFFEECGLKTPRTVSSVEEYRFGFPCFIKPKDGSSSINTFKVENFDGLAEKAKQIDGYIIQPFIDGTEYTIDIFCDFDGNPLYITPRERLSVRGGEVLKTKIVYDPIMIDECKQLVHQFKPCGAITVQLIRERTSQEDYYIEINPRYGGGAPLSMKAGADSAKLLLRLLNGEYPNVDIFAACADATYCRFDQCVCVDSGMVVPSRTAAVIFDLDDTLYDEVEYVKSGFFAVSTILRDCVPNATDELWAAFVSGQNAIDHVLHKNGVYSDELKEECLAAYRQHTPKLHLREGVLELFEALRSKGIRIGIITDGRPDGQRRKLRALGLYDLVDEVIITDELGGASFRKPNDISFRIMQHRLSVPFESMVYVGDNLAKDFKAPLLLGYRCVHFLNPKGLYFREKVSRPTSVVCIDSLNILLEVLGI